MSNFPHLLENISLDYTHWLIDGAKRNFSTCQLDSIIDKFESLKENIPFWNIFYSPSLNTYTLSHILLSRKDANKNIDWICNKTNLKEYDNHKLYPIIYALKNPNITNESLIKLFNHYPKNIIEQQIFSRDLDNTHCIKYLIQKNHFDRIILLIENKIINEKNFHRIIKECIKQQNSFMLQKLIDISPTTDIPMHLAYCYKISKKHGENNLKNNPTFKILINEYNFFIKSQIKYHLPVSPQMDSYLSDIKKIDSKDLHFDIKINNLISKYFSKNTIIPNTLFPYATKNGISFYKTKIIAADNGILCILLESGSDKKVFVLGPDNILDTKDEAKHLQYFIEYRTQAIIKKIKKQLSFNDTVDIHGLGLGGAIAQILAKNISNTRTLTTTNSPKFNSDSSTAINTGIKTKHYYSIINSLEKANDKHLIPGETHSMIESNCETRLKKLSNELKQVNLDLNFLYNETNKKSNDKIKEKSKQKEEIKNKINKLKQSIFLMSGDIKELKEKDIHIPKSSLSPSFSDKLSNSKKSKEYEYLKQQALLFKRGEKAKLFEQKYAKFEYIAHILSYQDIEHKSIVPIINEAGNIIDCKFDRVIQSNGLKCYFLQPENSDELIITFTGTCDKDSISRDFANKTAGLKEIERFSKAISKKIEKKYKSVTKISITGHSLGGCDAQNFTANFIPHLKNSNLDISKLDLITFNAPGTLGNINKKAQENLKELKNAKDIEVSASYQRVNKDIVQLFGQTHLFVDAPSNLVKTESLIFNDYYLPSHKPHCDKQFNQSIRKNYLKSGFNFFTNKNHPKKLQQEFTGYIEPNSVNLNQFKYYLSTFFAKKEESQKGKLRGITLNLN